MTQWRAAFHCSFFLFSFPSLLPAPIHVRNASRRGLQRAGPMPGERGGRLRTQSHRQRSLSSTRTCARRGRVKGQERRRNPPQCPPFPPTVPFIPMLRSGADHSHEGVHSLSKPSMCARSPPPPLPRPSLVPVFAHPGTHRRTSGRRVKYIALCSPASAS